MREFRVLGPLKSDGSFSAEPVAQLAKNWKRENLRVVVFVQQRGSRHILGAAEIPLAGSAN